MTSAAGAELTVLTLSDQEVRARLSKLRRDTAPHHDAVERRVDLHRRLGSVERYTALLARLHGFYEPLEAELERAVSRWHLPFDVEARRKTPLIARDLAALGMAPGRVQGLPRSDRVPRPASAAATLGCLYVTEGATLGGRLISRLVEQRLGFGPGDGAAFFCGYGADTGRRWRSFTSLAATRVPVGGGTMVAGAIETFEAYDRWLAGAPC